MPRRKQLKELELRRRELVLQSSINRLTIGLELQNVQAALLPAERIVSSVRAARPWLLLLAPLAGMVVTRGHRSKSSGFAKVLGVLKWVRPLLAVWKQFGFSSDGAGRETPRATAEPGARV